MFQLSVIMMSSMIGQRSNLKERVMKTNQLKQLTLFLERKKRFLKRWKTRKNSFSMKAKLCSLMKFLEKEMHLMHICPVFHLSLVSIMAFCFTLFIVILSDPVLYTSLVFSSLFCVCSTFSLSTFLVFPIFSFPLLLFLPVFFFFRLYPCAFPFLLKMNFVLAYKDFLLPANQRKKYVCPFSQFSHIWAMKVLVLVGTWWLV